ncbi:DUF1152 domain-containing protein [Vulcanisaeta souniana]|uniref:DUF1152 domain-containing protein n=1 Tax=Vulcanisaeta souniana JCM 11219 TaxID=1293586 RepID=A0A830E3J1_9CREN|nr:DUF1152 domain-containing protein [Vulcanisaeta souniana]BDR93039.1 hypothetical protein Vsou_21320 [Vulcanisaeta souniana JCM 11219]GGI83370.1 hypothetical protein GCM10007112_20230 [Vulcanisaeta souniana JCM 11219]
MIDEILGFKARSVLIIGLGGGGDAVGSSITYNLALGEEKEATLGAVLWERYVSDPVPGPIRIQELQNSETLGNYLAIVNGDTYAIREGRHVIPQIANVLGVIKDDGLGISISGPVINVAREISEYVSKYGFDAVIGIDVGGDALALGSEDELYSPLADSYSVAILTKVQDYTGIPVVLGVAGPGVDGELNRDYVLMRISQLAGKGAFLGAYGPTQSDLVLLEDILGKAITEASQLVYKAARGYYGDTDIRGGTRKVKLDISSSITYYLDLRKIINELPLVNLVINARDPWDAMKTLNSKGVMTELNFEEEVYRYYKAKSKLPSPEEAYLMIREIRNKLRNQLESGRR